MNPRDPRIDKHMELFYNVNARTMTLKASKLSVSLYGEGVRIPVKHYSFYDLYGHLY